MLAKQFRADLGHDGCPGDVGHKGGEDQQGNSGAEPAGQQGADQPQLNDCGHEGEDYCPEHHPHTACTWTQSQCVCNTAGGPGHSHSVYAALQEP